eukprot:13368604-Alexandrium_andersonii.AAC.1
MAFRRRTSETRHAWKQAWGQQGTAETYAAVAPPHHPLHLHCSPERPASWPELPVEGPTAS